MDPFIPRAYRQDLQTELLQGHKIILLFGPRQVGKTTLARKILTDSGRSYLEVNADLNPHKDVLSSRDLKRLRGLVDGVEILFIDEAQRIPDIGINLKILHDQFPELKIIATGSSSLELANLTKEALTGRTLSYLLFPIAIKELTQIHSSFEITQALGNYLLYGMYPEILSVKNQTRKIRYLRELVSSYLYKDVLELTNIKHAHKLSDLLRLLAYQVGSQVSLPELGQQLGMAKETVESYLDLLEKSFVIFRLRGFSRNLHKEVSKMSKYYFYDLGVRNVMIDNFNLLPSRNDVGQLWENFLVAERKKKQAYAFSAANAYFWRTYDRQELDYVEESGGELHAFEFKFKPKQAKAPVAWRKGYPNATFSVVHQANFLDFLV